MGYEIRKAVRAVVAKNGEVCLIYDKVKHYYQLPGGGLEGGESFEKACIRECREETNMEISIVADLGSFTEILGTSKNVSLGFLCKPIKENLKALRIIDEDETSFRVDWVNYSDAISLFGGLLENSEDYKSFFQREIYFLERAESRLRSI